MEKTIGEIISAIEHNARGGYSTDQLRQELVEAMKAATKTVFIAGVKAGVWQGAASGGHPLTTEHEEVLFQEYLLK